MYQLEVRREFSASVEKLFGAWCDVDTIRRWFAPGAMTVSEASVDVKVGGHYRIVMQDPEGELYEVSGSYEQVIANEKLIFSWQWKDSPNKMRVAINFTALGADKSELVLQHSELIDEGARDKHKQGWSGCLDNLGKIF